MSFPSLVRGNGVFGEEYAKLWLEMCGAFQNHSETRGAPTVFDINVLCKLSFNLLTYLLTCAPEHQFENGSVLTGRSNQIEVGRCSIVILKRLPRYTHTTSYSSWSIVHLYLFFFKIYSCNSTRSTYEDRYASKLLMRFPSLFEMMGYLETREICKCVVHSGTILKHAAHKTFRHAACSRMVPECTTHLHTSLISKYPITSKREGNLISSLLA